MLLANLGSSVDSDEFNSGTVVKLMSSVIEEDQSKVNLTSLTWDWRNKYVDCLKKGKLPSNPKESKAIRTKAARFSLVEVKLYRRSFFGPLARCLGTGDTDYVMREVHEGTCGNHSGAESLVRKLIRAGYYWNKIEKDGKDFVQKCNECQRAQGESHSETPSQTSHTLPSLEEIRGAPAPAPTPVPPAPQPNAPGQDMRDAI
uniref:Uncharacterized protein LOC104235211 n=1 Tax=Nicotiana sylvestris TaxID=4096 RepID=A0A1U7X545_NICSY|nr:PREDICTED: uncharacterized protein LOC104235211 [Nicotiana sylvestris]